MNKDKYINELVMFLEEAKKYIARTTAGTLAKNDNHLMLELTDSYYETFENYKNHNSLGNNEVKELEYILDKLAAFRNYIIDSNSQAVNRSYFDLKQIAELEENQNELIAQLFQSDSSEMALHTQKIEIMQVLVDMDIKIYGNVRESTLGILEVQHCKVLNNLVYEVEEVVPENYIEEGKESLETDDTQKETTAEQKNTEKSYQGYAYLKSNGRKQIPTTLYGNSPEDIITTLQGWNMTRTEKMQLGTCYIRKFNPETNKYENPAKYDISSGIDITPIYLNLPHMGREKYLSLVKKLKEDGARYNPVKKAFFITKQHDLNKFSEYLPISGTQAEIGENRSKKELSYEISAGQEYYDNRVQITIEGMAPFHIYGDDYNIHFPSLGADSTREIIEKFVLPGIEVPKSPENQVAAEIEYNGQKYNPLQYNILQLAERQNFTPEQMKLLEQPELPSDRMNEIRFAIKDGLTIEQISKFATPAHEQWQMDFCRIGMQNGLTYEVLSSVINSDGYKPEKWGERRSLLAKMIQEHNQYATRHLKADSQHSDKTHDKISVLRKLNQNKDKVETQIKQDTIIRNEKAKAIAR